MHEFVSTYLLYHHTTFRFVCYHLLRLVVEDTPKGVIRLPEL